MQDRNARTTTANNGKLYRPTAEIWTGVSGSFGYAYDADSRLTSLNDTTPMGTDFQFNYNAASQLTDVNRYSATTASTPTLEVHSRWGYDLAGRLTSITHGKTQITAGQTRDASSTAPASLSASNTLAAYFLDYDQANRLTIPTTTKAIRLAEL